MLIGNLHWLAQNFNIYLDKYVGFLIPKVKGSPCIIALVPIRELNTIQNEHIRAYQNATDGSLWLAKKC